MLYSFDRYCVDVKSRELRTGEALIEVEPQVFDLLVYLIANRDRSPRWTLVVASWS